jgi:amidase
MAHHAGELALQLSVVAGPDELMEGAGYKLALPPPRHDKLADFRVLVIDEHPLSPTAASIVAALDGSADPLGKAGSTILRTSPKLPDLAPTSRIYAELLFAFYGANLNIDERERVAAAVRSLSSDDQSFAAARLRGLVMSHPDWVHASYIRSGLRARSGRRCSRTSMS